MPDPTDPNPIPLEDGVSGKSPIADLRKHIPEPLPVRLISVEDVHLPSPTAVEELMDAFYVTMLGFAKAETGDATTIRYHAENCDLVFDLRNPPLVRNEYKVLGVEIPSLRELKFKLIEREIDFEDLKTIIPGERSVMAVDPAGNYINFTEIKLLA